MTIIPRVKRRIPRVIALPARAAVREILQVNDGVLTVDLYDRERGPLVTVTQEIRVTNFERDLMVRTRERGERDALVAPGNRSVHVTKK